jgi:hypothetical protein
VARAEKRIGLAPGDQVGCNANRSARLSPCGAGGVRHLDYVRRLDYVNLERTPVTVVLERQRDRGGDSDKEYLQVEVTGGGKGAVHDGGRRVVATHRVDGDANHLDAGIDKFTNLQIDEIELSNSVDEFVNPTMGRS